MRLFSAIFGLGDAPAVPTRSGNGSQSTPLLGNLNVRRLYLTYVLEISFRSPDRQKGDADRQCGRGRLH